jgi:hypothetical protein
MTGVVIDPHFAQCLRDNEPTEPADCLAALVQRRAECDGLRAEVARLREALQSADAALDGEPEYHIQGMGCGLEDRNITDRYEAMQHGWDQALERVYSENIAWAKETIRAALTDGGGE